jgi:hypothetical protein
VAPFGTTKKATRVASGLGNKSAEFLSGDQHLIRAQRDDATSLARRRRRQARMDLHWLIMASRMSPGATMVKRKSSPGHSDSYHRLARRRLVGRKLELGKTGLKRRSRGNKNRMLPILARIEKAELKSVEKAEKYER